MLTTMILYNYRYNYNSKEIMSLKELFCFNALTYDLLISCLLTEC